jgi:hypothetical protein
MNGTGEDENTSGLGAALLDARQAYYAAESPAEVVKIAKVSD